MLVVLRRRLPHPRWTPAIRTVSWTKWLNVSIRSVTISTQPAIKPNLHRKRLFKARKHFFKDSPYYSATSISPWSTLHVRTTPFPEFPRLSGSPEHLCSELLRQGLYKVLWSRCGTISSARSPLGHHSFRCTHTNMQDYWNPAKETQYSHLQPGYLKFIYLLTLIGMAAKVTERLYRSW